MEPHPHHRADLAALLAAIDVSGSEASIVAALVDDSWCPTPEAAQQLIARLREMAA